MRKNPCLPFGAISYRDIVKYRAKRDSARGQPKVVYVLSTSHGAAMKNTNRVDTDGNVIQKQTSIIDYNHNMGGVDLVDQQLDSLDVLRKSYKWYKSYFSGWLYNVHWLLTNCTRNREVRMISFSFFKMYVPYFFRMNQDWKEIHLE